MRKAREKLGKTQCQMAFEIKVSQPTICSWELGETKPRPRYWGRIAIAYDIPARKLVTAAAKWAS